MQQGYQLVDGPQQLKEQLLEDYQPANGAPQKPVYYVVESQCFLTSYILLSITAKEQLGSELCKTKVHE